jgi:hypothetical protein
VENEALNSELAGGGLRAYYAAPLLGHCTFYANAGQGGAGICVDQHASAGPVIERTIVAFSSAGPGVGVIDCPLIEVICCDFYGNDGVSPRPTHVASRLPV